MRPLVGTPLVPARFVEGVADPPSVGPGDLVFATASSRLTGGASATSTAMLDQLSYLILDPVACQPGPDGYYKALASDVVRAWYRDVLGLGLVFPGDPTDVAAADAFRRAAARLGALTAAERTDLLTEKAPRIRDCSLGFEELP